MQHFNCAAAFSPQLCYTEQFLPCTDLHPCDLGAPKGAGMHQGMEEKQPACSSLWDSTLSSSFIPLFLPPNEVHTARTPPSPAGRFYCVSHHFARIHLFPLSPFIPDAQPIITDPAPLIQGKSFNLGKCKGQLLILMEFFAGSIQTL